MNFEFKTCVSKYGEKVRVKEVATVFTSYGDPYCIYKDIRKNYYIQIDDAGGDVEMCDAVETDEEAVEYLRSYVDEVINALQEDEE